MISEAYSIRFRIVKLKVGPCKISKSKFSQKLFPIFSSVRRQREEKNKKYGDGKKTPVHLGIFISQLFYYLRRPSIINVHIYIYVHVKFIRRIMYIATMQF